MMAAQAERNELLALSETSATQITNMDYAVFDMSTSDSLR
jgi:hypothetical protein